MYNAFAADVQVGFQSSSYVGMESIGRVTVCVFINVDIDRSVEAELTAITGSASGNTNELSYKLLVILCEIFLTEQDYTLLDNLVLFSAGSTAGSEQCKDIIIVNDGVREDVTEEFSLMLTTEDPGVILQPNTTQVFIIDNDSKKNNPT